MFFKKVITIYLLFKLLGIDNILLKKQTPNKMPPPIRQNL